MCDVRIGRMANGYSVRLDDPKIRAENAKPSTKGSIGSWKDPSREYVFKTCEEVLTFLEKSLDKALPNDDYSSSFDSAVNAASDKD